MSIDWMSYIEKIVGTLGSGIGNAVNVVVTLLTSTVSIIVTIFISLIFSMYMLIDKEKLFDQSKRLTRSYLSGKHFDKISHVTSVLNDSFRRYIVGQFTEAIVLGMLCAGGMFLLKLPYAAMTGTVVGVTALIPIVGAYIGAALGAFMILTENPSQALVFLIFLVILQQLEGNLIYPKVVGSSIGLPGIWVLAAVTVGGSLFGITGMLIGVPLTATIYKLVYEDIGKRERVLVRKNHKTSSEQTNKPEKANKQDENVKNKNTKK
jgi:predicted PurR-regulated permease PerM